MKVMMNEIKKITLTYKDWIDMWKGSRHAVVWYITRHFDLKVALICWENMHRFNFSTRSTLTTVKSFPSKLQQALLGPPNIVNSTHHSQKWLLEPRYLYLFWWGGHCCPMHSDLFEIYCVPPNLGIIRTWIYRLNFAQRPIFSGLRFFNEPEISESGPSA